MPQIRHINGYNYGYAGHHVSYGAFGQLEEKTFMCGKLCWQRKIPAPFISTLADSN